ncbi:hypothetical protein RvY_16665 [Ramazzottius varieornatus]|uniref:Gustatory receptor n=1 Tax=Ramazzottius varieornatus TaxID=947166 RepID=A0A1D1W5L2_RAMVA|nr:hypothetical protein RvY_16665 [Ramazzottius varieornatus]
MPYLCVHFRGLFVLVLLLVKRQKVQTLPHFVDKFCCGAKLQLPLKKDQNHMFHTFSLVITTALVLSYIAYDYYDWIYWLRVANKHLFDTDALEPLPIKVTVLQYLVQWSLWVDFPLHVSQLIFACIITLAWIVYKAVQNLHVELNAACERTSLVVSAADCNTWRREHLRILVFVEEIKSCFGEILVILYLCDLGTLAGLVAQVLNNHAESGIYFSVPLVLGNALLFASYQTVFAVPLVMAYEEVNRRPML